MGWNYSSIWSVAPLNFWNRLVISPHTLLCMWLLFYHDVGEIFWPQPIRSLKLGHVTGQGSMSPTWVGRVSDPGKNSYLITYLKLKWKNKQIKNMNNWIWLFFIYVLKGNLQWNSWIFKMIDYLKGSIVKFKLNFEKALKNKHESVWGWQISNKTLVCLGWGNLTIVNNLYFQNIILSKTFWLILICSPRMIMAILSPILIKCTVRI